MGHDVCQGKREFYLNGSCCLSGQKGQFHLNVSWYMSVQDAQVCLHGL